MSIPLNTILSYFETNDVPTQEQFAASWSSFHHKGDKIPISGILNLELNLQNKLDKALYVNHLNDSEAHSTTLAKLDGSNLNTLNVQAWKQILGVGTLPSNIATVDSQTEAGNTYTKDQISDFYMAVSDYIVNGKISADKIEALGITELIEVAETSLPAFITNSGNYDFQKNDFIAIPVNGNYSLYLFKGGDKGTSGNYLPTGLTNISIGMVEGLTAAINSKMDKPTNIGSFFIRGLGVGPTYGAINPAVNSLLFWDGSDFRDSNVFVNSSKIGIGTNTPTESLHVNGRTRTKALVLDTNTETLPNQLTTDGNKFWASSSAGVKRPLMFQDYASELELWQSFSDAQKTAIKTTMNGGWTTNTMSVAIITPPIAAKQDKAQWFVMRGANLNLNPANFAVYLIAPNGTEYNVPSSQVQLYASGLDIAFWYNFKDLPLGVYKIKLWNGLAYYVTGAMVTITLVSDVTPIDFSGMTWSKTSKTPSEAENSVNAVGTVVSHKPNPANANYSDAEEVVCSAKSTKVVDAGDNFYIKSAITVGTGRLQTFGCMLGVGLTANPISLANSSQLFCKVRARNSYDSMKAAFADTSLNSIVGGFDISEYQNITFEVIYMRNQGVYTVIISNGSNSATFVKTGSDGDISLLYYGLNARNYDPSSSGSLSAASVSIIEGFKF